MAAANARTDSSSHIHLIFGNDGGKVREHAQALWNELTGGVDDGYTHIIVNGQALKSEEVTVIISTVCSSLRTYPMFGGTKVVYLKNANFFGEDRVSGTEETKTAIAELQHVLAAGIPDSVRFIISTESLDQRREFAKFIQSHAQVQIHNKVDISKEGWEHQVSQLVLEHAQLLNLRFADDALELFIMQCNESTNQIKSELEKLDLYIGERREIELDDVRNMTPLSRLGVVFETGNALRDGNAKLALALLEQQLEMEDSPIKLMRASIINPMRNMFHARVLMDLCQPSLGRYDLFVADIKRVPASALSWLPKKKNSEELSIYPIFLAAKSAKRFSLQQLEDILHVTARADKDLVTSSQLDGRLILHRLITEIASIMHQKASPRS